MDSAELLVLVPFISTTTSGEHLFAKSILISATFASIAKKH
jgi:hypothetical protein